MTEGNVGSATPPSAPGDCPPAPPRGGELKARVLSAACLAPLVLWTMWRGGDPLLALLAAASAIALGEWALMLAPERRWRACGLAAVGGAGVFLLWALVSPLWAVAALPLGAALAGMAEPDKRGLTALGAPYVIFGCVSLWALAAGVEGRTALFFIVLVVWATDIGAYAAGRTIGGPKLAPKLSPKKTWAGLLGGMAAAGLVAALVTSFASGGALFANAALGAGLAAVAQVGDLFESWAKRRAGVKDSSKLIPGHGGLLDRIDGLLAAAPALALHQAAHGSIFV